VHYRSAGRYAGAGGTNDGIVNIDFQQQTSTTAAGHFRDIKIHFDVDGGSGSDKFADLFNMYKFKSDGSADDVGRGHSLRNLTISGTVVNCNQFTGDGIVICETAGSRVWSAGTGTTDLISGIALRDLQIIGTPGGGDAVRINGEAAIAGRGFVDFDNYYVDGAITITNGTNARVSGVPIAMTPAVTFATPGNLSVAYTTQTGKYVLRDGMVHADIQIVTSTFTHTTASGNLSITGFPFASVLAGQMGAMDFQGITKAGYTQVNIRTTATTAMDAVASASGSAVSAVTAADMPTGGTVIIQGSIAYRI
jgi:hypothetical protein